MTGRPTQQPAAGDGDIGLYRAGDFRLTDGRCTDCDAIPQALWYFRDEAIAVPRPGLPVAGFARGASAFDDVARWAAGHAPGTPADYPTLIWVGSPAVLRGARLDAAGTHIAVAGTTMAFDVVPKIPLNRSYYNAASVAYFTGRTLKMRGETRRRQVHRPLDMARGFSARRECRRRVVARGCRRRHRPRRCGSFCAPSRGAARPAASPQSACGSARRARRAAAPASRCWPRCSTAPRATTTKPTAATLRS